jgi:peptidoglycan/LPS O-acetylase OafA/YrhL
MYGAVCACLIESDNARVRAVFGNRVISLWLPLVGLLVLSTLPFKGYDWTWYTETSVAAFLTALMILHQWARPLTGDYEPIATIGRISYSIYLLHVMIIEHFFPHAFPTALEFSLRCGALIGFSLITYDYIELPFIALSKRLAPMGRDSQAQKPPKSVACSTSLAIFRAEKKRQFPVNFPVP